MTTPAPHIETTSTQVETIGKTLAHGRELLAKAGIESAFLDARLLMQYILGCTVEQLFLTDNNPITAQVAGQYFSLIERRVQHEPVAKILGKKSFWKYDFLTTKDTLDPRPETEIIVEAAMDLFPEKDRALRVVDLGTGTGCILLSILGEFPNAVGTGADISKEAVAVAAKNAVLLQMQNRAEFLVSDWCSNITGMFDLITANPPYISEGQKENLSDDVACYDPDVSLYGGSDGLAGYKTLLPQIKNILCPGGIVIFEIGAGQEDAIIALANTHSLTLHEQRKDLAGTTRTLVFKQNH